MRNQHGSAMYDAVQTPEYDRARGEYIKTLRALRNHPDGFWVAKNDPRAADEAIRGTVPAADLTHAALLSEPA